MKTTPKQLEKSQIEVYFELSADEFKPFIDKALDHLKSHVKMDGFRPGQVPKELAEKKIKQEDLLMEAGELAVKDSYAKFIEDNHVEPIGQPAVQIKKIAKGSEFLFTVTVSVLPEVQLPDYKKIASQVKGKEVSVTEKEIEDSLRYLQKSRAKFTDKEVTENGDYVKIEYHNKDINEGKVIKDMFILGQGGFLKDFEENLIGMKKGDEKEFQSKFPENAPNGLGGKDGQFHVKMVAIQKMELPAIDDVFAKELGNFDSLATLKNNLKEGIGQEKQEGERERKRQEILRNIVSEVKLEVPESMIEYEQKRLFENVKNQVAQQFKIPFQEYLTSIKKTEQELQDSYHKEAQQRIEDYLIIREIGRAENIQLQDSEIENEVTKMIQRYPKEQLEKIDIARIKEYTKDTLYNEKVFQLLENLSKN